MSRLHRKAHSQRKPEVHCTMNLRCSLKAITLQVNFHIDVNCANKLLNELLFCMYIFKLDFFKLSFNHIFNLDFTLPSDSLQRPITSTQDPIVSFS